MNWLNDVVSQEIKHSVIIIFLFLAFGCSSQQNHQNVSSDIKTNLTTNEEYQNSEFRSKDLVDKDVDPTRIANAIDNLSEEAFGFIIDISHSKSEESTKNIIEEGIKNGITEAKFFKGMMIYAGLIYQKDIQQALEILESAAASSSAGAHYMLGLHYLSVEDRFELGLNHLKISADKGYGHAQSLLAMVNSESDKGEDSEPDVLLLRRVVKKGNSDTSLLLKQIVR